MFLLAERLGKTVAEIETMSATEFLEWMAFDEWRHIEREHADKVAEMRQR